MRTRTPVSKTIAGFTVTTTRLPPTRALKLLPKITKIFTHALPIINGGTAMLQADAGRIVGPLTEMLSVLDDAMLDLLVKELLSDTTIIVDDESGRAVNCDLNTAQLVDIALGGLDNGVAVLAEILVFAAEVNYAKSFFDLAALVGLKRKRPGSVSA